MATLGWFERQLCVVENDVRSGEPVTVELWWPVAEMSEAQAADYVGKHVIGGGSPDYCYRICDPSHPFGPLSHLRFPLRDGGQTKAIRVIERPIPCPKVRKGVETRWDRYRGRWEKYLKASGWVAA